MNRLPSVSEGLSCVGERECMQRVLCTELVSRGEDGRAEARVVVAVGKGGEAVLQAAVAHVQSHQTSAYTQQQHKQHRYHHCRCVT